MGPSQNDPKKRINAFSLLTISFSFLSLFGFCSKQTRSEQGHAHRTRRKRKERKEKHLLARSLQWSLLLIHSFIHSFFFFFSSLSSCHSLCTHFLSIFFSFWLRSTLSSSSSFSTIKPCHNNKVRSTCSTPKIIIWVLLFFHLNANGFVEKFAFDDLR